MDSLADVLPMLAFFYLAQPSCSAARPRSSWPSSGVIVAAFAALRLQDWADPVVALVVVALALVLWGAVRGQLRRREALVVEMAGVVGFTAIALAAVSVNPDLDRYIVAAGWIGYAAWNFARLRADKVVARSFAEWCTAFDVLRAVGILILPMP